jgi:thiamine-monophosphate kinase
MKLHALVDDLDTARVAVEGGATVVQWRLKDVPTLAVVERGRSTRSLCARSGVTFVVNDDVEAALMLGADGVHLGQSDEGADRAKEHGLLLGLSASSVDEARAVSLADYVGAGPIWETPTQMRRSGSTAFARSARRSTSRSSRSVASTPRTQPNASVQARQASPLSVLLVTPRRSAKRSMKLSELGELGLLAELEQRGLVREIENDAAEIGELVVTQDALVEGVHFRLDWISWRDLGWRAAAANLSDLAASGADPIGLIVTLGASGEAELDDILDLYAGITETGVPVLGGDTTRAPQVLLSVTALGRADRVPGRAGAQPGDLLVVTGPLGAAGAAFREEAFVRPPLRIAEGLELAKSAHAMLDVSDGLAVDAAHLARRSGCRIEIELATVPLADGATIDDLGFGEDYELLAAVDDAGRFVVIGSCTEGEGVAFTLNGGPFELRGWEHFS